MKCGPTNGQLSLPMAYFQPSLNRLCSSQRLVWKCWREGTTTYRTLWTQWACDSRRSDHARSARPHSIDSCSHPPIDRAGFILLDLRLYSLFLPDIAEASAHRLFINLKIVKPLFENNESELVNLKSLLPSTWNILTS